MDETKVVIAIVVGIIVLAAVAVWLSRKKAASLAPTVAESTEEVSTVSEDMIAGIPISEMFPS